MKKQNTRRSLLLSALSMLLCVSMLIGTTFAWFTDSVESGVNKIEAGNLDIELYHGKEAAPYGENKKVTNTTSNIFTDPTGNEDILWEPGAVAWTNLNVVNEGSLALKYQLAINFDNATTNAKGETLAKVLKVGFVTGGIESTARADVLAEVSQWQKMESFIQPGTLAAEKNDIYGIVIYWEPSNNDNDFNLNNGQTGKMEIDLGIKLIATQLNVEEDSFDKDYDAGVRYPLEKATYVEKAFDDYKAKIHIPAGAPEPADATGYYIDISNYSYINEDTEVTVRFDMKLMDSQGEVPSSAVAYDVEIQLPHPFVNENNVQLFHNGALVNGATYDKTTYTIHFTTTDFSPFEIKYVDCVDPSYELDCEVGDNGQCTVKKGMFVGINPAEYDTSLRANSDYIVVDFVKDGVIYYIVSEQDNTVFIAPDATDKYTCTSGTYDATNVDFRSNQSGKLYLSFGDFENSVAKNDFSTVYLLPGTYNEETVINVISNVDIIGLGGTDEVKVIKVKGSYSNKHLFNCTGTKADYIQVTLRNMYLDANASNLNSKGTGYFQNNAAVQAIRKTKVKCYDLTINKTSMQPFIVNATNAVNNVVYPSYMYVENCSLNGTAVYDKSGEYYFYHFGLTCKGNPYTVNSGKNVKNVSMTADDWDWVN